MQITLPEIDNYTLYYETFVFILRVYSIMLFDYVYRCTQSSARVIRTLEDNYKPANGRHARRGERKGGGGEEDDIRGHMRSAKLIGISSDDYYNVITTRRERPSSRSPRGRIESKAHSRARALDSTAKNSKLLILIRAGKRRKKANVTRPAGSVVSLRQSRSDLQLLRASLS